MHTAHESDSSDEEEQPSRGRELRTASERKSTRDDDYQYYNIDVYKGPADKVLQALEEFATKWTNEKKTKEPEKPNDIHQE